MLLRVASNSIKLIVLQPQPPECWDYKCALAYLALDRFLTYNIFKL
jgi:hypothetical protein